MKDYRVMINEDDNLAECHPDKAIAPRDPALGLYNLLFSSAALAENCK